MCIGGELRIKNHGKLIVEPGAEVKGLGVSADVDERLDRLSEDVEKLKGGSGGSSVMDATKSGDVVTVTPVADTTAKVISKITGMDAGFSNANKLILRQIKGKNLFNFAELFGGVGKIVEKGGLTATINANGTVTITGTNTSSGWINILEAKDLADSFRWIFPAGTYTVPMRLNVSAKAADSVWTQLFSNKSGTFTVDRPFWISAAYIAYASGAVVNDTIPLTMVSGTSIPSSGYAFEGEVHTAVFANKIGDGEFNWQTGELKDADGNLIETITPFEEFPVLDGANTFMTGVGVSTVTYKVPDDGSGDSGGAVEAFDPEDWGLPVPRLSGNTTGMDKDNAVTLNYVFGLQEGTNTLKWQGSSSLAHPEKNYTIVFDEAFEAKEGWGEQTKYVMKADWIDASHLLNILGAIIWGQIVKRLGANYPAASKALPNGGAIDGFPVLLVINDKLQGLYTFTIPKDGWMAGMTGQEGEFILNADGNNAACAFKELPANDDSDFEEEFSASAETLAAGREKLATCVTDTISAVSTGENVDKPFDNLNYDSALDYMVFSACLCNPDGITKNYQLFGRPSEKLQFSAYDMDAILGNHWNGKSYYAPDHMTYAGLANGHNIFKLIYDHKKADLKARHKLLRETILNEANILTVATNYAAQIPSAVMDEDRRLWPGKPGTLTNDINRMMNFLRVRLAIVDAEIEAL